MTLLRLEGVGKRFGGVVAVNELSFAVEEGAILGLMGANGAGKTTAFGLIAGNLRPSSGTIQLDGRRIDGLRPNHVSRLGIARTFQIVRPFPALTVLDNVATASLYGAGRERSPARARTIAHDILAEVGLADRAAASADALTLSGRKRLEVARALATMPRLLLLDEVMAGLTATEVAEALAMLQRVQRGRRLTIIIIEHVMKVLMRLCDRIVVLHHGEKIAEGPPDAVANDPAVIDAYFGSRRP